MVENKTNRSRIFLDIANSWGKEPVDVIADRCGISPSEVLAIVDFIKKKGFPSPRERKRFFTKEFKDKLERVLRKEVKKNMTKTLFDLSIDEKKAIYLDVVKNWGTVKPEELATRHNVKRATIANIASRIRKRGIPLPRLGVAFLDENFVAKLKEAYSSR